MLVRISHLCPSASCICVRCAELSYQDTLQVLELGSDKLKNCRNFVKVNNNALTTAISELPNLRTSIWACC